MNTFDEITAATPIDGRYASKVSELRELVSEYGLIKYRIIVEVLWLKRLGQGVLPDHPELSTQAITFLDNIIENFNHAKAQEIKQIENELNHDVKSVEVWITRQLPDELFKDYKSLVHFGCTSEDINNLSYAFMVRDVIQRVVLPRATEICDMFLSIAQTTDSTPMLARTHGQPASPVTLGKEMRVYVNRLEVAVQALDTIDIFGKFNGATGGYSAAMIAYPEVEWPSVAETFVEQDLGFRFNPITTQIEPHDWIARVCSEVALINTILTDLATDLWQYISVEYFVQQPVKGEVGSSTMPHKVNPINFENAEGNFGIANALLLHLASKLPQSRLQRDLSDSTAQRSLSEAFAHSLIGYKSLQKGLSGIKPNPDKMAQDLQNNWAVLTEAIQSVMRRYGSTDAYDQMKAASRGKVITEKIYKEIVSGIAMPDDAKARLMALTPATYTGRSADITKGI